MQKEKVKLQFSKHAHTYSQYAYIQDKVAKDLVKLFGKPKGFGVDLGCGTGFVSSQFTPDSIIGVDISQKMVLEYKRKGYIAVLGDVESLPFKASSFNFAVSSFSLHWVNLEKVFRETYRVLKKNGIFIASIPVKRSLENLYQQLGINFSFPTEEEVVEILLRQKFLSLQTKTRSYYLSFASGYHILKFFKHTGTNLESENKNLGQIRKIYKRQKPLSTKFEILFFRAVKG